MKREKFEEFLAKVRTGNEPFMLTDGTQFYLFTQLPVNDGAKIVYSNYTSHHCNASDMMNMKLEPVALVCGERVILYDDYRFRVGEMKREDKWEDNFGGVISFDDLLKINKEFVLNNLIPELYKQLPQKELDEGQVDNAKQEARRHLLHKELCSKKKPLVDIDALLTEDTFIRALCGELDLEEHITAQYFDEKKNYAWRKAYEEEVQKHIDSPICATWELELAEVLYNTGAKTVNMTFAFEGKSVTSKIKVDEFLREFMNNHDIDWWCFLTTVEGKRVLKELGSNWDNRLYAYHIDEVAYNGKTIYTAPEEAKSLRGDYVEKEEDYER